MKRIYAIIEFHAKSALVPLDFPKPSGSPSGPLRMFPVIPLTVMRSGEEVMVYISSVAVPIKTSAETAISMVVAADLVA